MNKKLLLRKQSFNIQKTKAIMDCYIKIKPNHKKVSCDIPSRYKEKNYKFIFGETKIRSNEAYSKAYRKKSNLRLLDGFTKPEVSTNETNSEIWDIEELSSR